MQRTAEIRERNRVIHGMVKSFEPVMYEVGVVFWGEERKCREMFQKVTKVEHFSQFRRFPNGNIKTTLRMTVE